MGFLGMRRRAVLPRQIRAAVPLRDGDRIIAWARDDATGGHIVASTHHLSTVTAEGGLVWQRPWHEVDAGTWQGDSRLLTVEWVDGRRPAQWLVSEPSLIQEALRERVQASVVLAAEFRVAGGRRRVRVVIRQDLAGGGLLEQVIPGKGVDPTDPQVAVEAERRLAALRSEVGL